jgi:hypothetical protein
MQEVLVDGGEFVAQGVIQMVKDGWVSFHSDDILHRRSFCENYQFSWSPGFLAENLTCCIRLYLKLE